MKKPILNYLLIVVGTVLLVMNFYENNYKIDQHNFWRLFSALCFIALGFVNTYHQRKKITREK